MRIAIVHETWESSGAARCARDLEKLLRQRHEVMFFPRMSGGIKETPASLFQGLANFSPDVVNCHSFYTDLPYSILAELSKRYPVCYTVHDPRPIGTFDTPCWDCTQNDWCMRCPMVSSRFPKPWNWFARRRIASRLCHWRCAPDLVMIAPSQWLADRLALQELRRFRIETIPNGVDLDRFSPAAPVRERFGLPSDGPVLLHLAVPDEPWTVNDRKGLPYLTEAFVEHVLPRIPSATLAVAGERVAPNHPSVRPLGRVRQENLPDLLRSVDVFVAATLADNLPYTVMEAMACGTPVVAFAVGGVPEQIVNGETGVLTPPRNARALGEAIATLLATPERMAEFGRNARRRAEQLYPMNAFVGRYEALFAQMACANKRLSQ
jgi:glycosyltransferase involved in cell wall biosynthesis